MVKIRIASPCSADWSRMEGTDRIRYCPECKLNVYNFSEMSEKEIRSIVAARTGRLCARFYQRPDGTLLTKNCPIGFRGAILRATRLAGATLTTLLALAHAKPAYAQSKSDSPLVQTQLLEKGPLLIIVDASGAVIPYAEISLVDKSAAAQRKWTADQDGRARITGLSRGPHDLAISAPSSRTRTLHLEPNGKGVFTVQLEIASVLVGEVVEMPAEAHSESIHVNDPLEALRKIRSAKTVFFDDQTRVDGVGEKALEELKKVQRFQVVQYPVQADLILVLSAGPYKGGYIVASGGQTGSIDSYGRFEPDAVPNFNRAAPVRHAYLTVIDPKTGGELWTASHRWGGLLTGFTSAGSRLINKFEKQTRP